MRCAIDSAMGAEVEALHIVVEPVSRGNTINCDSKKGSPEQEPPPGIYH